MITAKSAKAGAMQIRKTWPDTTFNRISDEIKQRIEAGQMDCDCHCVKDLQPEIFSRLRVMGYTVFYTENWGNMFRVDWSNPHD